MKSQKNGKWSVFLDHAKGKYDYFKEGGMFFMLTLQQPENEEQRRNKNTMFEEWTSEWN